MKFLTGLIAGILLALGSTRYLNTDDWQQIITARPQMKIQESTPRAEPEPVVEPVRDGSLPTSTGDETTQAPIAGIMTDQSEPDPQALPAEELPASEREAFQVAWMPFKSETSATGFADKLSDQLHRPFEITRKRAGRYEVGFRYSTRQERDSVLSSIESITGYRVPGDS